jgi:Cytochrome c554 and c-prime
MRRFGPLALLVTLLLSLAQLAERPSPAAAQSAPPSRDTPAVTRAGYAGDEACRSCHKQQSEPYVHTAHHLTSQLAGPDSILGSFGPGDDVLRTANPGLHFTMEAKDDGYFETAVAGYPGMSFRDMTFRTERIDLVIGSGHRAQTYLYWRGDQLFELPVSSWLEGGARWVNSPGYDNGFANFERTIPPRCLECHATFIRATAPGTFDNHYDRASFVPGVSCETCHGPGREHIARHAPGSPSTPGQAILNPAGVSRDRQIDLCALCHNGIERQQLGQAFSYLPGQPLSGYLQPNPMDNTTRPDVHGNQVGLLKRSRCFLSSSTMTCTTCHDVHAAERDAASYSGRCLQCHQVKACGMYKAMGEQLAKNCIDCHMPLLATRAILATRGDETIGTKIRTHWIKVYPAQ